MTRIGMMEMLFLFAPVVLILIPFWRIFQKAGYPGAYAFLMLIPGINLIVLYYLAFSTWPAQRG